MSYIEHEGKLVSLAVIQRQLTLAGAGSQSVFSTNPVNDDVEYWVAIFPTLSSLPTYLIGKDDIIKFEGFQSEAGFSTYNLTGYFDLNFYLSISASGMLNASITQTVSSYEEADLGNKTIVYTCNIDAFNQGQIARSFPEEFALTFQLLLVRTQMKVKNAYGEVLPYKVRYLKYTGSPTGKYFSFDNPALNGYYRIPLMMNYPINKQSRANFKKYLTPHDLEIYPYFGFTDNAPDIGIISAALDLETYKGNIVFDNRACLYTMTNKITLKSFDYLKITQYNHKKEEGRCQYSSIAIYDADTFSLIANNLTIPMNIVPDDDVLFTTFINTNTYTLNVYVVERIYQYPMGKWSNTEHMLVQSVEAHKITFQPNYIV